MHRHSITYILSFKSVFPLLFFFSKYIITTNCTVKLIIFNVSLYLIIFIFDKFPYYLAILNVIIDYMYEYYKKKRLNKSVIQFILIAM